MQIHEIAITIGAIGTMLSAAVATRAYIIATRKSSRAQAVDKASAIRRDLQNTVNEVQSLKIKMREGIAIFSASQSIANEIKGKLHSVETEDEIESIITNEPLMLSACVNGWHNSHTSNEISNSINSLRMNSSNFTGGLQVLGGIVDLFGAIASDGYSPLNFHRILLARSSVDSLRDEIPTDKGVNEAVNAIVVSLQSNAVLYFASRYEKAISEITKLVEEISNALIVLSDDKLLEIHHMKTKASGFGATRITEIKQLIRDLEPYLSPTDINMLITLAENVGIYISKERAREEAKRLAKK